MNTSSKNLFTRWCAPVALSLGVALFASPKASAVFTLTSGGQLTAANTSVNLTPDAPANVNVAGMGALLTYAATPTTQFPIGGNYGPADLNNGDAGNNTTQGTGLYAIINPGTITLTLGTRATVGYIAIYDGYTDRNDGNYTVSLTLNGTTTTLGSYNIVNTATTGSDEQNNDNFLLQLNTPQMADSISITYATTTAQNTASFREIQVFAAPEPGTYVMLLVGAGLLFRFRKLTGRCC